MSRLLGVDLFACAAARSAFTTKQYKVNAIFVQLAGVLDGAIVPIALLPPNVDEDAFVRDALVPEFARLVNGVRVTINGACVRVRVCFKVHALSHASASAGALTIVVGDIVSYVGDHVGQREMMQVPGLVALVPR